MCLGHYSTLTRLSCEALAKHLIKHLPLDTAWPYVLACVVVGWILQRCVLSQQL